MFFKKSKALNYDDRADGIDPYIILLHYTGMQNMEEAKERLSDPKSKVSAHYLIDEDGSVFDLVPEEKRAWHAGISYWRNESDINSASIGIEVVNLGHEFGYPPFPNDQIYSVLCLCQEIQKRYEIKYVLAHSDVAPERKQDPGELFDWERLALGGVGIWPEITQDDRDKAAVIALNDFESRKLFDLFGYNPMAAYIDVVTAFQRHYYPKIFEGDHVGEVCEETIARLLALVRHYLD